MDIGSSTPVVVLVAGPQASGKSTLSAALSGALRGAGESVALVELDAIAAMALPTLPDWAVAHRIFESVTGQWARAGLACVIAEGSGSQEEVSRLRAQVPDGVATLTVAVTASFDVALARARRDPTRGVSRERRFLRGVYERWPDELARIAADLVVDTDATSVQQGVGLIRAALATARSASSTSG